MSSVPSFSAPPRRAAASAAAAPPSFSSFGRSEDSRTGGRNGFDAAASSAFGKKPARTFTFDSSTPKVVVTPAKNTLASVIDGLLPPEPESNHREWSTSALQKQRKAAVAEKAKQPKQPKSFDEEFPALGGMGGGDKIRVPKPVFASASENTSTSGSGSFASLASNWAKSDEERQIAEATSARARMEQQRQYELERSERIRFNTNLHAHTSYHNEDEFENGCYDEDEYVEGELDEYEQYSKKDILADKRAAANHYSDEEEDDAADYNGGAW